MVDRGAGGVRVAGGTDRLMHELTRRRIIRKLEALPDDQLYQVLDFIEFLENKYAPGRVPRPSGFERFAERVEDGMRARAVGVRVMGRTMKALGSAGRVLDGLASAGRQILEPPPAPAGGTRPERVAPVRRGRGDRSAAADPAPRPATGPEAADAAGGGGPGA